MSSNPAYLGPSFNPAPPSSGGGGEGEYYRPQSQGQGQGQGGQQGQYYGRGGGGDQYAQNGTYGGGQGYYPPSGQNQGQGQQGQEGWSSVPPDRSRSNLAPPHPYYPPSSDPYRRPGSPGRWDRDPSSSLGIDPSSMDTKPSPLPPPLALPTPPPKRSHHAPKRPLDPNAVIKEKEKEKAGPSEFIKKLYKMLEEDREGNMEVVSWGFLLGGANGRGGGREGGGDGFVVKDMNLFTTKILPQTFRHSNFSSFVRQLNKYGFAKVKHVDERSGQFRESVWEFRHPGFWSGGKADLEGIKRKVTVVKRVKADDGPGDDRSESGAGSENENGPLSAVPSASSLNPSSAGPNGYGMMPPPLPYQHPSVGNAPGNVQEQLAGMQSLSNAMYGHLQRLQSQLENARAEMSVLRQREEAREKWMPEIIGFAVGLERDIHGTSVVHPSPNAARLISTYNDLLQRLGSENLVDPNINLHTLSGPSPGVTVSSRSSDVSGRGGNTSHMRGTSTRGRVASGYQNQGQSWSTPPDRRLEGIAPDMQVPEEQVNPMLVSSIADPQEGEEQVGGPTWNSPFEKLVVPDQAGYASGIPSTAGMKEVARRGTIAPSWMVPPRVLVVEDDAVSRNLSRKFLELIGCSIDVAVDGEAAVQMMRNGQYDLCLMDIGLPLKNGVQATTLIRQFDHLTPIISMTASAGPNDVLNYLAHGMNDILPKPFTKYGLFGMLEKHLEHLKGIRRMSNDVTPAVTIPLVSDQGMQEQISNGQGNIMQQGGMEMDGSGEVVYNPLANMGLSDDAYMTMLQNFIATGSIGPTTVDLSALTVPDSNFQLQQPPHDQNGMGANGGMKRRNEQEEYEEMQRNNKRARPEVQIQEMN